MLEDFPILLIFTADVVLQGFDEDKPAGDDCAEGLGTTETKHHTTFNTQKNQFTRRSFDFGPNEVCALGFHKYLSHLWHTTTLG